MCSYHRKAEERRQARGFYTKRLAPEEQEALADAAELEGIDEEIRVLRVLIRRVLDANDIEAARKGIATLLQVLKASHKLEPPSDGISETLGRVLDRLGADWDVDL